ncbi:MAG TPA: tetratricopeptide repeat protein, partial [Gammaproteobacteria bacterium]|nr:tetratricopeptide repeat protein [Gammaproteobacteria bacterium]
MVVAAIAEEVTKTADTLPPLSVYSNPSDVWKKIADIESEQKNYQNAIEALKNAINLQPKNASLSKHAPLYVSLSEIYAVTNQYKEALTAIDEALKIESRNIDYLNRRVMLANWAGEYDQVEDTYKRILNVESKNQMARVGLQNIEAEKAKAVLLAEAAAITTNAVAPINEKLTVSEAAAAESDEDWDKAISLYKEVIAKDANRPDLWRKIADIENTQQHYPAAIEAIQNAIKLQPQNAELYVSLSETYAVTNQAKEALSAIDQALQIDPMNTDYLNRRAILASWAEEYAQAEDSYRRILNVEPGNKQALAGLLNIEAEKLKAKSSTGILTVDKNPSISVVAATTDVAAPVSPEKPVVPLAAVTEAGKNRDKEITLYKEQVAKDPNRPDLWKKIADLEMQQQHYENAIEALNNAIKLQSNSEPKNVEAENEKAKSNVNTSTVNEKPSVSKETTAEIPELKASASTAITTNSKPDINVPSNTKRSAGVSGTSGADYAKQAQKYSEANRPQEALLYINLATVKEPRNISYYKLQGEMALKEKNYTLARKSYDYILAVEPYNKDALLGMANLEVQQNNLDAAVCAYENYLALYPDSKEVWLDYAALQSRRGNFVAGFHLIRQYKDRYGETYEYLSEKARLFEMAGYPEHALSLVNCLLVKAPNDYDLRFIEASALEKHNEPGAALKALDEIERKFPKETDNKELREVISTPNRSSLTVDGNFYHDTDDIKIVGSGIHGEYFIRPGTSIIYGLKQENLSTVIGTGGETIDGHGTIWDNAQWVGLTHQISPKIGVSALGGIGEIKKTRSFFLYDLNVKTNPNDYVQMDFQKGQDLYASSPSSVSLRILQKYNRMNIDWQPYVQKHLIVGLEYDHFSDNNKMKGLTLNPYATILSSQYFDINFGPYANWQKFSLQTESGYYSPRIFQLYQALSEITYKQSDNINYILTLAAGTDKDETMLKRGFAGDLTLQAIYGIYAD